MSESREQVELIGERERKQEREKMRECLMPEEVGHDVCLRYCHMTLVCVMSVEHSRKRQSVTHGRIQPS